MPVLPAPPTRQHRPADPDRAASRRAPRHAPTLQGATVSAAALLALLLAACATTTEPGSGPATTFIVVRHAEKVDDGSPDPALTAAGQQRAEALAASLAGTPLAAVYATGFQRTRQTALPTARAQGLEVTGYDAKAAPGSLVARLKRDHAGDNVLVVGHSNTVPGIVAALCGCEVDPMDEREYDRRTTVNIGSGGKVTVLTTSMPPADASRTGDGRDDLGMDDSSAAESAEAASPTITAGVPFALRPGERAGLPDVGALVYLALTGDSRCPPGVQCIWAGEAELAFQYRPATAAPQPVTLIQPRAPAARVGPWMLELLDLEPGPAPRARLRLQALPATDGASP